MTSNVESTSDSKAQRAKLLEWRELHQSVRNLTDAVASMRFEQENLPDLTATIASLARRVRADDGDVDALILALDRLPSRGRVAIPPFEVTNASDNRLEGTVSFGKRFIGRNNAAHGGAVAMVFDEALGALANPAMKRRARTARLETNFRQITPLDRPLTVKAEVLDRSGRKIFTRAVLLDGETVCADASALFLILCEGQP